ncbi:lipocalin family protein [Nonlabens xiamenensis]|uniref:lipocalin family protein n=1 Tax=Nonlabens xiamenensis TaxID=2341043 RepID=UPI000F612EB8|nr:lipocalin family protein [Nonlabens xiamenensis]
MKKSIFGIVLSLFLISCGSTTNAVKQKERTVRGNWTIQSVTYDGVEDAETILLQDVSADCFEGSDWYFVANNNRGTYTINDINCNTGERKFIWTVPGNEDFVEGNLLIKVTGDDYKSETNAGYSVQVSNLSEYAMTWTIPASIYGKSINVNMNFIKVSE